MPPSPRAFPILGHIPLLASNSRGPHLILFDLAKKLGLIFYLRLGYTPTLVISSAKIAQEILKTHDRTFSSRPSLTFAEAILPDDLIFARYGTRWRELRKICTLELFTARRVGSFAAVRQAEMEKFLAMLSQNLGRTVNMTHELSVLTLEIMQTLVFGTSRTFGANDFLRLVHQANELGGRLHIGDYVPWLKWMDISLPKLRTLATKFHALLQAHIEEHRSSIAKQGHGGESFLDVLLSLDNMSDLTIRCLMLDAVSAGLDTTATAIEWALIELLLHPQILAKAQKELDDVIPASSAIVSEADIPNLKYLGAIVKKSLRQHPPAPLMVPRESTAECKLEEAGYMIPAKTQVLINLYAIGRDPNIWENPLEFILERMSNEFNAAVEPMTFCFGRRSCPGMNLGLTAVHLVSLQVQLDNTGCSTSFPPWKLQDEVLGWKVWAPKDDDGVPSLLEKAARAEDDQYPVVAKQLIVFFTGNSDGFLADAINWRKVCEGGCRSSPRSGCLCFEPGNVSSSLDSRDQVFLEDPTKPHVFQAAGLLD
ncbi:cytochrome P450 71A1 [Selaginella moellendorffii]|uniref:cytochrome P450 71A1 n=1 Tax=Selaginella moellendorffii TaxID=88036 RepID=UPI000D1C52C7|nr:cytochrome P450 71A1 [Selaginella moellendorffii]|eukprot:XP_002961477.2 cytochrome P450 71A1 [Selaginella moellendorffii]